MTYSVQHAPQPRVVFGTNSRNTARRWAQQQASAVVVCSLYGCHQGTVQCQRGRRVDVARWSAVSDQYLRWLESRRGLVELPPFEMTYNAATRDVLQRYDRSVANA